MGNVPYYVPYSVGGPGGGPWAVLCIGELCVQGAKGGKDT